MYFKSRKTCEICGSSDKGVLLSRDFLHPSISGFIDSYYKRSIPHKYLIGNTFEVLKCRKCGFVWQSNILRDDLMGFLYEKWISAEDSLNKKKYADIALYSFYADQMKVINNLVNKKPYQTKVLDFGMGWGYWCLMAKAFGYDVEGYEVSPQRIRYVNKMGIRAITDDKDLGHDKFDFINATQVFEHLENPLETSKKLNKSLKTGGIIYISVPDSRGIEKQIKMGGWRASKNAIHPLEHINCFTPESLLKMMRLSGFEEIDPPILYSISQKGDKNIIQFVSSGLFYGLRKRIRILNRNRWHAYFRKVGK